MEPIDDLILINGRLTILVAFGHGGEVEKTHLTELLGSEVFAERWNKPIVFDTSEVEAFITPGSEKIKCHANISTDIFIAGVSIVRIEVEIRDRIIINSIMDAIHSNKIILDGLDFHSFTNKKINEVREKLNPGKKISYHPVINRYITLKIRDYLPRLDEKGLKEQYGELITRFLSGETSIRALHGKEIAEKMGTDLSYYDEDLYLVSSEGAFILGCEDYQENLRELLELSISLLLLFQIYDRKIDSEIANAFLAIKKLQSSRFYTLSWAPKFEKSLLRVSEIELVILDDIEDLMNPHKISPDWYYQSVYMRMLNTLKVWDFEKVVQHKIDTLQELYNMARQFSTERLTILLEIAIVALILWEVVTW
ncbi:MAG: hypothetical protein P1P72_04975 [ANME-2 cluster archaeon]|nr:hypothetical protein [ANME-2 cluster archaeon]